MHRLFNLTFSCLVMLFLTAQRGASLLRSIYQVHLQGVNLVETSPFVLLK